MTITAGSLFTGMCGLDFAAKAVLGEARTLWHSDIKPAAMAFLDHRFPDVPNLGDITEVSVDDIEPTDLIAAGWPCQPFSAAGRRRGEEDPRALWPDVHRVIAATRPKIFCGENVARACTIGELRRVVRSLAEIGYVGAWRCVRASDVGACHRRERMFLLAVDARSDEALELLRTTFNRHVVTRAEHDPSITLLPTPTKSMTTVPGAGGRDGGLNLQTAVMLMPEARDGLMELLPTPTANHGDARRGSPSPEVGRRRIASGRRMLEDAVAAYLTEVDPVDGSLLPTPTVGDARNTRNATARRAPENDHHHSGWALSDVAYADRWNFHTEVDALLPTPTASQYGTNIGGAAGRTGKVRSSLNTMAGHGEIAPNKWGPYAAAIARWTQVFGAPPPSPTMISPRTNKPQLSPDFVEWMQGFWPGYVADVPGLGSTVAGERNGKLSLLGDAVVPQQGAYAYALLLGDLHRVLFGQEVAA